MILSEAKNGEILIVENFSGCKCMVSRLAALGIYKGSKIEVIDNSSQGQMLVAVLDSRLALGKGIANKIAVKKSHLENDE